MSKKKYYLLVSALILILLVILFELIRDTFFMRGDFKGYVLVGNFVLNGEDIYTDPIVNTWPPFFSIVSVPIALIDNLNGYLVRFLWLSGIVIALVAIIKQTLKLSLGLELKLYPIRRENLLTDDYVSIIHPIVIVPLLIILRYIMENMSYIQINVYMLLMALSALYLYEKKKPVLASLILAFSIALKIYTVFLLVYFIVKKEYKIAGFTILFVAIFMALPGLVFGYNQTIDYYSFWYKTNVEPFAFIGHKNQSYFSLIRRLFVHESPGLNGPLNRAIYINILNLEIRQVKIIAYGIIGITGIFIMYLFKEKLSSIRGLKASLEYAIILNAIPLLSPLAWKAFFIFLFPAYFLNYVFIFSFKNTLNKSTNILMHFFFYVSIVLTVFSSELFVGPVFSDILEVFSAIAIGSILLLLNLIIIHSNFDKFNVSLAMKQK